MDGLRSFIEEDNRIAVDVGGLRRGTRSIHGRVDVTMSVNAKTPQLREALPEAIRELAGRVTVAG